MAKTYVQRIAEIVARKHNLSQKDAETFVSAMFAVVNDGLQEDKQVKVKGLGTFKVVAVKSRESVNVNTGERITLEEHEKVSFTPDTAMKELVNKPFAQFETVVLNDGVDLDAIDRNHANEEQKEPEEPQSATPEEPQPAPEEPQPIPEEPQPAPEEPQPIPEEPQPAPEEPQPIHEAAPEEPQLQPEIAEKPEVAEPPKEQDEPEETEESHTSHRRLWTLAVLGVLIVAAVAGYFWYNHVQNSQPLPPLSELTNTQPKPKAPVKAKPAGEKPQSTDTTAKPAGANPAATPAPDAASVDLDAVNRDPHVRAGAYNVVGVDTVVTLKAGQTMESYCRHTLGRDMIVYFQALNGKQAMGEGERMLVPKVMLRKHLNKAAAAKQPLPAR